MSFCAGIWEHGILVRARTCWIHHLVALEAVLDKPFLFRFSFGVGHAEVCVADGKLLGHSRS